MSLDFSHIKTVFDENQNKKKQDYLHSEKEEREAKFKEFIVWLKEEISDKNIINAIKVEYINSEKPEYGLKITFDKKNSHISQICAYLDKVKHNPEAVQLWKEMTIKEPGCAVVGYKNIHWINEPGFDRQEDIMSYTVYLVGENNIEFYDRIFSTLLNNKRSLTEQ